MICYIIIIIFVVIIENIYLLGCLIVKLHFKHVNTHTKIKTKKNKWVQNNTKFTTKNFYSSIHINIEFLNSLSTLYWKYMRFVYQMHTKLFCFHNFLLWILIHEDAFSTILLVCTSVDFNFNFFSCVRLFVVSFFLCSIVFKLGFY